MLEWIADYFLQRGRLRTAGQFVTHASAYLCMFGAVAHFLTAMPAALQRRPAKTLANVFPDVPTWWIPERPVSFVVVVALGVFGIVLSLKGKQLDRYLSA